MAHAVDGKTFDHPPKEWLIMIPNLDNYRSLLFGRITTNN